MKSYEFKDRDEKLELYKSIDKWIPVQLKNAEKTVKEMRERQRRIAEDLQWEQLELPFPTEEEFPLGIWA